jgi:hypothetical protein
LVHPGPEHPGDQLGCFVVVERDDGDQPFAAGARQRARDLGCKETHLSALPPSLFADPGAQLFVGRPVRAAQSGQETGWQPTTSDPRTGQAGDVGT